MLKIKQSLLILFLSVLSFSANADQPTCQQYSFLKNGFNINDYKICRALIRKCPLDGVLPEKSCVNHVILNNRLCGQFRALSKVLKMPVTVINAKKKNNFTIVNVTYIADGQHQYYLISPTGCMVDTKIDPRKLDNQLNEKYKKTDFMIVNWREPSYQMGTDDSKNFLVPLRITDTCLACKVIGFATIKFKFDKEGNFLGASLDKFKSSPVKM